MKQTNVIFVALLAILPQSYSSFASVTVYKSQSNPAAKSQWQSAAGLWSTMDFTGMPDNTFLLDQYAYLGVHFTDGSDGVYLSDSFILDGAGLNGSLDSTTLTFDTPMTSIALDFPGTCAIKLFSNGQQIYQSPLLGLPGIGWFGGLISTEPFDSAQLYDPGGGFFADNLYFGPPIPAPGALVLFGVTALFNRRRSRLA